MGVLGLWQLLAATGKPVPLETLDGKVLAIDISIWIHQVIQGYQDRKGNPIPNAHLIGLFNRLCKLLYFKIKPIFVFDGGVPLLKKNTIAARRKLRSVAASKMNKLKNDMISNLMKHAAVKRAINIDNNDKDSNTTEKHNNLITIPSSSKEIDLYNLPELGSPKVENSEDYIQSDDENLNKHSPRKQKKWMGNIHSVDVDTSEFKSLPADVRYDILTDLKETRKQNSWGRLHELPAGSNNYAGFQIKRLLKRRYVQESLEKAEKEMGRRTLTLEELDKLLTDQGIQTSKPVDSAFRIASDNSTRLVYAADKPLPLSSMKNVSSNSNGENQIMVQDEKLYGHNVPSDPYPNATDSTNLSVFTGSTDDIGFRDWHLKEDFDNTNTDESCSNQSKILPKCTNSESGIEHSDFTCDKVLSIVEKPEEKKQKSELNSLSHSKQTKRNSKRLSAFKKKKHLLHPLTVSPKSEEKNSDLNLINISKSKSPFKNNKNISKNSKTDILGGSYKELKNSKPDNNLFEISPEKNKKLENKDANCNSESENSDESVNKFKSNRLEISHIKSDKKIMMDQSDSDSDNFADVEEASVLSILSSKTDKSDGFQIIIKTDEELENDIFADVFDSKKIESTVDEKKIVTENLIKNSSDSFEENKQSESSVQLLQDIQIKPESSTPEKKNSSLTMNNVVFDTKNLSKNMSPEEILNDIKLMLTHIRNYEQEESNKNIFINEPKISEDFFECITTLKSLEDNKNDEDLSKNTDEKFSKTSKDTIEADVIDELFRDKGLDNGFEEVMISEKNNEHFTVPGDEEELEFLKQQLESEQQEIASSLGKLERQAVDITDQMRLEAQELLRLFGYPYIVAPMEAEAQCAYLEQIKLTNGTVTDDSDVWLFGGHCVYKNFFDNNKKVLQFLSNDIEHHFNLTRKEMIQLALLVGSDYTDGLKGVGPVTALEILAAFPSDEEDLLRGLHSFCSWFKEDLKVSSNTTLRKKLKNVQIEKGFPSQAVVQAYMCPMVDESNKAFSWGKPNFLLLSDYVKQKFGWTKLKFDEILNPILKRLNESKTQKVIENYFKIQTIPKSIESAMSKRVQTAVQKLSGTIKDDKTIETTKPKKDFKFKSSKITAPKRVKKRTINSCESTEVDDSNKNENKLNSKKRKIEVSKQGGEEENGHLVQANKTSENNQHLQLTETEQIECVKPKRKKICMIHEAEEFIPQREHDKINALKKKTSSY